MVTILTVEDCLETCSKFCKGIEKSFGPRGELSFIISCTGKGQFTTSGMTIMDKIQYLNPLEKIILQTIQKNHDNIGDGSKTFVLLLHEILFQIVEYKNYSSFTNHTRIKLMHNFNFLLHNILPECFMELRHKILELQTEPRQKEMFSIILHLLKTFFSGKFGLSISDYLSDLVHCFLLKHSKTWENFSHGIKHVLDNFNILCSSDGTMSLNESQIIPGVVLSREFAIFSNPKAHKPFERFLIVDNASGESLDAAFSIKGSQQLYTSVDNEFCRFQMLIEQKKQEVSLIICTGRASDQIKGLCSEYGIQLITMAPREEINYLLLLSHIQPVRSFSDKISVENYGTLSFVKSIRIRNKTYAYLGLKCKQSNSFPYHLILNGPSDSICKQYLKEIQNSLKLIYVWINDSDRSNQELYRGDSKKNFKENSSLTCVNIKYAFQNSSQQTVCLNKLDSFEHTDTECSCFSLKHLQISKFCPHFMIYPAGGCWELCLHHILAMKKLNNPDLLTVCTILSKSLIIIPRTLYKNNYCKQNQFPLIWKLIMEKLHLNKICFIDKWGDVQTSEAAQKFEPVIAKEMLISQVIQLVIQLLRLQSIVA